MARVFIQLFLALLFGSVTPTQSFARGPTPLEVVKVSELPKQARDTLALVKTGGPFPYEKDGVVFGNREGVLPKQKRGYYSEYTVKTPGVRSRGARRIVAGADPRSSGEYYYTEDHYVSFRKIVE
jgi:ribonuclease T1